ncbi:hypothetical protein TIFTF001_001115 [Ficus carica]|uniref:Uncharacterized protein n=1 Tax=Ficus carica TaxID=3494 RepID=A0AA87Z555_FICCA|nr:hypothetical protein TIFTF001_001115 [Ficus carica]
MTGGPYLRNRPYAGESLMFGGEIDLSSPPPPAAHPSTTNRSPNPPPPARRSPDLKPPPLPDYFKKSGQIPAFGNWDYANELPITQYFECARQAGLIRYSSSSGDSSDPYLRGDLYAVDHHPQKPYRAVDNPLPARKLQTRGGREKRCPHVKEQKKQAKVCDVTEPPRNKPLRNDAASCPPPPPLPLPRLPKPVDEDLYKIPPELLHASKRVEEKVGNLFKVPSTCLHFMMWDICYRGLLKGNAY